VNPYAIDETADALAAALTMPADEQARRLRAMRATVAESNAYRWAAEMLTDAGRLRASRPLEPAPGIDWSAGMLPA
jgi:trehalose 6-phosphate synthase